jgi:hypothetical protein
VVFKLSGKQLKEIFEWDVDRIGDRIQVSGLKYTHYSRHAKPFGDRINFLEVNGETVVDRGKVLRPDKMYSIVSNDYLVGQAKDKYFGFAVDNPKDTEYILSLVLMAWLEKNKKLVCSIEDRILELGPTK